MCNFVTNTLGRMVVYPYRVGFCVKANSFIEKIYLKLTNIRKLLYVLE